MFTELVCCHLRVELGIEAAGLRQSGRRLSHVAVERVSCGQTSARLLSAPADVDCLMAFVDSRVEMKAVLRAMTKLLWRCDSSVVRFSVMPSAK